MSSVSCVCHSRASCRVQASAVNKDVLISRPTQLAPKTQSFAQNIKKTAAMLAMSASLLMGDPAQARLEGVNKPELLPPDVRPVLDVAGFLTEGDIKRLTNKVQNLEKDTGIKVRVLAQNYPNTPGLAIKKYWDVDGDTVVFVADPSLGNILNFNVGDNVDLLVPRNFWTKMAGTFGAKSYWQEKGESVSIINAVSAIDSCFREPVGPGQCNKLKAEIE